jgi:hypothetical protein
MATVQVGVLMDEIDFSRPTSTPRNVHKKPHKPMREMTSMRWLTFGVLIFAAAWEAGVTLLHLHPSRLTFTGLLAVLIFYTGEFLGWKRPRLPNRNRSPKWRKVP